MRIKIVSGISKCAKVSISSESSLTKELSQYELKFPLKKFIMH